MLYSGLDLLKFFFAIVVIAIHTHPFYNYPCIESSRLYGMICEGAVPFFFVCSGFFLGLKIYKQPSVSDQPENIYTTEKAYLLRIAKLYLTWTMIYLPLAIYGFHLENYTWLHSAIVYVKQIILVGENYCSWPLWYLLSTVYCALFLLLFHKKSIKTILLIGALIFIAGELVTYHINHHEEGLITLIIGKTIGTGRLCKSFLYIPLGILFSRLNLKISPVILIASLIASYVAFFFAGELLRSFVLIAFVTSLFLLVVNLRSSEKIYFILRKLSTYIYLTHMWVFFGITFVLYNELYYGLDVFFYTLAGSLALSLLIVKLKERNAKSAPKTHTQPPL